MSELKQLPRVLAPQVLTPTIESLLKNRVELIPWNTPTDPIEGIYCYGHTLVDGPFMDRFPRLRVISNHGVGVDHIDLEAAKKRNIAVGNTPRVLDGAVADLAIGLIIAAARKIVEGDRISRASTTQAFGALEHHGWDVHQSTLGILGMGNIGSEIAKRARAFDMNILYHCRTPRPLIDQEYQARHVSLDELFVESDFVVVIVPLTAQTRQMIGKRELGLMKPTATLVNVARGGIVDTEALTNALVARQIFHAALDVTDPEPLPRDHPMLKLDNVTFTPHLGSATIQTRRKMAELSVANLLAGLSGKSLPSRIA